MGCTQSKIDNEEAVSRCKERKQHMKNAVSNRNAFSAAHSAYTMALKNTGAALSDYGQSEHNRLHPSQSTSLPIDDSLLPPPPPLPNFPGIPLQRAVSMPEFSIPKSDPKPADTIQEEDDADIQDDENENPENDLSHHRRRSAGAGIRTAEAETPPPPPSPPRTPPNNPIPPPPPESKASTWDYFFPPVQDMPGTSLSEADEIRPDKDEDVGRLQRSDNVAFDGVDVGSTSSSSSKVEAHTPEKVIEPPAQKPVKKVKQVVQSQTASAEANRVGKAASDVNLLQILNELDDHFLKASQSAHEVSKMLEANRLHYHSNFADNRGHIDHSARLMRVITWNRSFRGIPNADDGKDNFDVEENETHATVLDKLLAWEKKLYDEVKAGELMKLEYQRKLALLNKQRKRGTNSEALEKAKAAVSHLHTRYIVDMQSMDSTVSEISHLRDDKLYPNLVALVEGMGKMWETMHVHHDSQLKIVADLRYLSNSQAPDETSGDHHKRTVQLWSVVKDWHSQFEKLVTHQKEYIQALNNWLKLNLIPIESSLKDKVSSPPRVHRPPIQALLYAWHEHLQKLPDDLARSAINNFAGVIKTIQVQQDDEVILKLKCEETRKEFTRKKQAFEDWYNKYTQRRTQSEETDPEKSEDVNQMNLVADKQFAVDSIKKRLEEEVEAHQKQCRQVRDKSLGSLKTYLPELFRSMSDFSLACSDMYKKLWSITESQKPTESLS